MWPLLIVLLQPGVQVRLQFLQSAVELLAKQEALLLVLQGLVEPFTVAAGLGRGWPWSWSRFLKVSRSLRSHTDRTPPGEMMPPSLRGSLVALSRPKVGNSTAMPTLACSTASGPRFLSRGFLRETS